jgi:hypothetical protein
MTAPGCVAPVDDASEPEPAGEITEAMRPPDDYGGPPIGGVTGRGWHRDRPRGGFGRQPWGHAGPTHRPDVGRERLFQGHHDWRGHRWVGDRFEPPFEPGALVGPDQGARACTTATDGALVDECEQCVFEGGSWHVDGRACL